MRRAATVPCRRVQLSSDVRPHMTSAFTTQPLAFPEALEHRREWAALNCSSACRAASRMSLSAVVCVKSQTHSPVASASRAKCKVTAAALPDSTCQNQRRPGAQEAARVFAFTADTASTSRMSKAIRNAETVRPNTSLKLTRYGRLCKPGPRYAVHFLGPGLQSLPPRAA
jgi:hypothetical protein